MDTISHGFWNYFIFRKNKKAKWAAVAGGIFPDVIYGFGLVYNLIVRPFPKGFMELYLNTLAIPWVRVISYALHSLIIYSFFLLTALIIRNAYYKYFVLGWGVHLIIDIFTHKRDADPLFWPFSSIRFPRFISYWEKDFYGDYFTIANIILIIAALYFMLYIGKKR